jgi:tetratricopeptide (TPR) repeat protein
MVAVTWEYRSRVMAIWLWPNISLTILGGCRGQAAAWAIGQELGDEQLTAIPSTMIGLALAVQGQWAKAGRLLSQAVPALERSGEWREWCREVGYVGISVVARGDYHRGAAEAQRALDRALELSDQAIIGSNHILLCVTHVLNERMEALAAAAQEAVKAAERSGEQVILHAGLAFRGWANGRLNHHPAARRDMEQFNAVGAGLGRLILADWFAVARADIALAVGRIDEALTLAQQAVGITNQVGSVFTEASPTGCGAQALAAATPPRWDEAEAHMATSLRALESSEAHLPAAHAQLISGRLCRDRQDTAAALDHAQKAAHQFAASQLDDELRQTRRLIAEIADQPSQ